jgi:hypothetical protein
MALATSNVGYSLAAAVSWGAGDFGGGQAAKKGSVFGVVVLVEGVGLVFMLSLALFKAEPTLRQEVCFGPSSPGWSIVPGWYASTVLLQSGKWAPTLRWRDCWQLLFPSL